MQCFVSPDNGGESCDCGVFGEREVEFEVADGDEEGDIVEGARLGCQSRLHLTSILIDNSRSIINMVHPLTVLLAQREGAKELPISMDSQNAEIQEWL